VSGDVVLRARVVPRPSGLPAPQEAGREEDELLRRLRSGDERAFALLVDRHHAAMVRLARGLGLTDSDVPLCEPDQP
jgi:hypothetical protein